MQNNKRWYDHGSGGEAKKASSSAYNEAITTKINFLETERNEASLTDVGIVIICTANN